MRRTRLIAAILAAILAGCTSGSSSPTFTPTAPTFTSADLAAAKRAGEQAGYKLGYAKGYRLGKEFECNTLYGMSAGTPDGWHADSADPINGPYHKAIVLIWYAQAPNEVPHPITKADCLAGAKS